MKRGHNGCEISKIQDLTPRPRKLDRYLDVTKSAFLFGGRAFLVEGIAEALLLPILAKQFVLKDKPMQLRVFRSAVFVPIDGVDFKPYVRLLLTPYKECRIADRVVVLTDGDKTKAVAGDMNPGEQRKINLETLVSQIGASALFAAITSTYTLESELEAAGNGALLKSVYLELHPKSEGKWMDAISKPGAEKAKAIEALFESTRKGDFAVPRYIQAAIEALVQ
jgi:putative ATP-dependent endonuclease of the OLD family